MDLPLTFEKLQEQIDNNSQQLEQLSADFEAIGGSIESLNLSTNKFRLVSREGAKEIHEHLDSFSVKLLQLHETQKLTKDALEEVLNRLKTKDDQRLKSIEARLQQLEARP